MARAVPKTVRFTRVVERSGQPRVHTLWLPPEQDREFKRARDTGRVMTITRGESGKTDVGLMGFDSARAEGGQFLIFPKSLERFAGARVVGIKFDLLAQPELATIREKAPAPPSRTARQNRKRPAAAQATVAATAQVESKRADGKARDRIEDDRDDDVRPAAAALTKRERASPPPAKRARPATTKTKRNAKPDTAKGPPAKSEPANHAALVRAVRAAMKDLQRGKSVTAYQRLEKALG